MWNFIYWKILLLENYSRMGNDMIFIHIQLFLFAHLFFCSIFSARVLYSSDCETINCPCLELSPSISLAKAIGQARTLTLIKFISSPWADSLSNSKFSSNFSTSPPSTRDFVPYFGFTFCFRKEGEGGWRAIILELLLAHCYYGNRL